MKKHFFIVFLFFLLTSSIVAQQIGDGYVATVNNFDSPLKSGGYQSMQTQLNYPDNVQDPYFGSWKYLLNLRQNHSGVNYQLQLSGTMVENDRLFFRKIAENSTASKNTTWNEVATRGTNTFTGNQLIKGNINLESGKHILFGNSTGNRLRLQFWTNGQTYLDFYPFMHIRSGSSDGNLSYVMSLSSSGYVGIGTINPTEKLDVNGTIRAKEVRIENTNWPDYVFSKNYQLPSLSEVSRHIEENKHLPGIPSAEEVAKEGVNLSEMNAKLLQKIEEMTLYMIQQQKEINELKQRIDNVEQK